eukprot:gene16136-biopygen17232
MERAESNVAGKTPLLDTGAGVARACPVPHRGNSQHGYCTARRGPRYGPASRAEAWHVDDSSMRACVRACARARTICE